MVNSEDEVAGHYGVEDLERKILGGLEKSGVGCTDLKVDDLAAVDAFHIRGREATMELLEWADIRPGHHVLDVGCGIGGTPRYLAQSTGCKVTAIDLTPEYVETARSLTEKLDLHRQISYHCCSALALPFESAQFDAVWTEHVQMNIADKDKFYSEMSRVLKPGGQLVFHDLFADHDGGFLYPVPWAETKEISHLAKADRVSAILQGLRLQPKQWIDKTDASIQFFRQRLAALKQPGPPRIGLGILLGPSALTQFANMLANLEAGRIQVIEAVLRKDD